MKRFALLISRIIDSITSVGLYAGAGTLLLATLGSSAE